MGNNLHSLATASRLGIDLADYAPGLETAFAAIPREESYLLDDIDGHIPTFVQGTYYLNGPALFSRSGAGYNHWLDGDGMVCALQFGNREVKFTSRYVRTTKFLTEEQAGSFVFRAFGTAFSGDRLHRGFALESPANVSVYWFNGALLAFGEQSLPWQLDPETLQTLGRYSFGDCLTEFSPFAAHPKFDADTNEMFNFGVFSSPKAPKLYFYRFTSKRQLQSCTTLALDFPVTLHDFGLSANYAVFYLAPYIFDIDSMLRRGRSILDSLSWEPWRGTRLLILNRSTGQPLASIPVGSRYCLHVINCFEIGGRLFVDLIELDRPVYDQYQPLPNLFCNAPHGSPVRFIINSSTWDLLSRKELDYGHAPDFPAVDPRKAGLAYADFWMLALSKAGHTGRKFFDQLVRARWNDRDPVDIFHMAPGQYFSGEPVFIGNPADSRPDSGVVLCPEFDSNRRQTAFLIFNAFKIHDGPIARMRLKHPIHLGFHALWKRQPAEGPV